MKFIPYDNIIEYDYSKGLGHIFISNEEMEHELYSAFPYIGKSIDNGVMIPVEYYKKSEIVKFYKNKVKREPDRLKHMGGFTHLGVYDDELPLWACRQYENFINGKCDKIKNLKSYCFLDNIHKYALKYPDDMFRLYELKQANIGNHILFFEGTDDTSYAKKFKTYSDVRDFLENICFEKLTNLLYWN